MNFRSLGALVAATLAGCAVEPGRPAVPEPWYPPVNESSDPLLAAFEGRVPCAEPAMKDCEKVKVGLALYQDPGTKSPTTYTLARVYVASSPEGSRVVVSGTWRITQGMRLDPSAPVYRLDASAPSEFRSYWAIGEDILFVLDEDLKPRVGAASWSYVLNRTRSQGHE
jgi:NlpE N-terminal domain